jgi:hypothetical protein
MIINNLMRELKEYKGGDVRGMARSSESNKHMKIFRQCLLGNKMKLMCLLLKRKSCEERKM